MASVPVRSSTPLNQPPTTNQLATNGSQPPAPSGGSGGGAFALPTTKSTPRDELGDYTWLIYGERKIGKTSLAAQFPDALFMMFEPGGKGLSIYQVEIGSWDAFKGYVKAIKANPSQYSTIVIDTIDIAYEKCTDYVGRREGFDHPSEMNDFGKTWSMIKKEFTSVILDLIAVGVGVMFLSHATESEFQEASGGKYNKIIPTMPGQARKFVTGFVDIIAYYGYYGHDRLLTISGSDMVDAGHRVDGHFVSSEDPKKRIHSIPMGNSAAEGYSNILDAFNNLQTDTNEPKVRTGLSETKAKLPTGRR